MEIFDIVDENGNPTGETVERSVAHRDGIRHRTAHMWVTREHNGKTQILLQKRALCKDSFPGRYDTSSAGHIMAGDEPFDSAVRELSEELGIEAKTENVKYIGTFENKYEAEFHGKIFRDNEKTFVFAYDGDVDISSLSLQKEEVESVAWFYLDEVYEAVLCHDKTFCVPKIGLDVIRNYVNNK